MLGRYGKPRGNERWIEILETAAQMFKAKGYNGMSLGELASTLKITKASLYYYVRSKEELLQECYNAAFLPLIEEMRNLVSTQDDPVTKLTKMIDFHLMRLLDDLKISLVLLQHLDALPTHFRDQMIRYHNDYDSLFRIVLKEGMNSNQFIKQDATIVTFLIIGTLNWVPYWYKEGGAMSKQEIILFIRSNLFRLIGVNSPCL